MPKANYFFKCVVIGDIGVGKSNLLLCELRVLQGLGGDVGVDSVKRQIEHDGQVIEAQVWDGGDGAQPRYHRRLLPRRRRRAARVRHHAAGDV